jgi:hypothetical protein
MLTAVLTATAAVTLAVIGITLGTFTGGLPASVQRLVPGTSGAPAPGTEQSVGASAVGPSASSRGGGLPAGHPAPNALVQQCAGFERRHGQGGGVGTSAAFHALIKEAGGAGKVPAFCARVLHHVVPPHPKKPHPPGGGGNAQGNGNGNGNAPGKGNPTGGGNGPPHANANSQGNGNGNAQGSGVPDPHSARGLVPHL